MTLSREWKNYYTSSFHSSYLYRLHLMHFHLFSILKQSDCPLNVEKIAVFKGRLYTDPVIENLLEFVPFNCVVRQK